MGVNIKVVMYIRLMIQRQPQEVLVVKLLHYRIVLLEQHHLPLRLPIGVVLVVI